MWPRVSLRDVSREDVARLCEWLQDEEVHNSWYGCDESGAPVHVGYIPQSTVDCSSDDWEHTFEGEERKIYSHLQRRWRPYWRGAVGNGARGP